MERETEVAKEFDILQLSGLNEATDLLHLERHQFATLQNLFPYEVGALRRLNGKAVEQAFAGRVMGVFQMHTPVGSTMRLIQTDVGLQYELDQPSPWGPLI
jgi:hypothetical protein